MLSPDYLEKLPETLIGLWQQVEDDILRDLGRRIAQMRDLDALTPAAQWQAWRLEQSQLVRKGVLSILTKYSGKSKAEIRRLLLDAGRETLAADDAIYRAAGLSPSPIEESEPLNNLLNAGYRQTLGTWQNLTATTANTVTGAFEQRLDEAWLQISSGAFDYDTAIRRAVEDLADRMPGVTYPSGHRDTLEVAVRRAVLTGVNQTCAKLQLARADEMGCAFVEVTAHEGARPEHALWQGKIYHRGGAIVYEGVRYEDFETATGYGTGPGLCGWNCRHNFYPFFPGISVPNYTAERLAALDAKTVEYDGKRYIRYEIAQMQRALERRVRRYKRHFVALQGAKADTTGAALRLREARQALNRFLEDTGGKPDSGRTDVAGFGYAQARETTRLVQQAETEYTQKREAALQVIHSADTPKTLNAGHQRKHLREEGRDIGNRSFLYGTMEDAQQLVDRYSGTGEPKLDGNGNWTHKEFVTADHLVGESVNPETGIATPTHRFAIHYGKRGTHVVPMEERKT